MSTIESEEFISYIQFFLPLALQYQIESDSDTDSDKKDSYQNLHQHQ